MTTRLPDLLALEARVHKEIEPYKLHSLSFEIKPRHIKLELVADDFGSPARAHKTAFQIPRKIATDEAVEFHTSAIIGGLKRLLFSRPRTP